MRLRLKNDASQASFALERRIVLLAFPFRYTFRETAGTIVMTTYRDRVTSVFEAAVLLEPAQRLAFVREACAGDSDLRRQVESMLADVDQPVMIDRPVDEAIVELMDDDTPVVVGAQFGPYRVESLLGVGGMGAVYRATDSVLARQIAIKILPADVAADPEWVARFRREAQALAALSHPNVGAIYGFETVDGPTGSAFGLVLELVEGATLAEKLKAGPLPVDEGLAVAQQVDPDGNDLGGIRDPEAAVPLATTTGWNFRDPSVGNPGEISQLLGSYVPFAPTRAARQATGDPRLSLEERYRGADDYLQRVRAAAMDLIRDRYMLEEDLDIVLARARSHWAYATRSTQSAQPSATFQGVWRTVEVVVPGPPLRTFRSAATLAIFHGRHYSRVELHTEQPRPQLADPAKASADELRAVWGPFVAEAGTFELRGDNTITMRATVAKNPAAMVEGASSVYTYRHEGDLLLLTQVRTPAGPSPNPVTVTLRRIE
jgi:hypothetical protein